MAYWTLETNFSEIWIEHTKKSYCSLALSHQVNGLLDPWKQISVKFESKHKRNFHTRKVVCKMWAIMFQPLSGKTFNVMVYTQHFLAPSILQTAMIIHRKWALLSATKTHSRQISNSLWYLFKHRLISWTFCIFQSKVMLCLCKIYMKGFVLSSRNNEGNGEWSHIFWQLGTFSRNVY